MHSYQRSGPMPSPGAITICGNLPALNLPTATRPPIRVIWIRILPPPNFFALPIAAENEVEIAIPINVIGSSAGFDGQKISLDHDPGPSRDGTIPDERWRNLSEAENEIISTVFVKIRDD